MLIVILWTFKFTRAINSKFLSTSGCSDGSGYHQKLAFKKSSRVLGGIFRKGSRLVPEKRLLDLCGTAVPFMETRVNNPIKKVRETKKFCHMTEG